MSLQEANIKVASAHESKLEQDQDFSNMMLMTLVIVPSPISEGVDYPTHLPTQSSNCFAIVGVAHDASQRHFLSARPTNCPNPGPGFQHHYSRCMTRAMYQSHFQAAVRLHDAKRDSAGRLVTVSGSVVAGRVFFLVGGAGIDCGVEVVVGWQA